MPDDYFLSTEINASTNVLLVDEVGGFTTLLIDSLLSRGFTIYYFGCEPESSFDYLAHKKTFVYLSEFNAESGIGRIDYLFYFPKDNLASLKNVVLINKKFSCRVLIGIDFNFKQAEELDNLSVSIDFVFKLVFFKDIFGPRVINGNLGGIFSRGSENQEVVIDQADETFISPLFSKTLVEQLLTLAFIPYGKGKVYLLKPEEITYLDFTSLLKSYFPEVNFVLTQESPPQEDSYLPKRGKTISVKENLSFRIEETAEWFSRERINNLVKEEKEPRIENPRFSTEIVEETAPAVNTLEILFTEKNTEDPVKTEAVLGKEHKENLVETYWQEKTKKKKFGQKSLVIFLAFLLLFFSFFVLPMGMACVFGIKGFGYYEELRTSLDNGNFEESLKISQKAEKSFNLSQKSLAIISPFYSLIGLGKQTRSLSDSIMFSVQLNQSMKAFLQTFTKLSEAGLNFLQGESVDWLEVQKVIKTNYSYAYQQASLAQSSLKEAELGFSYFRKRGIFDQIGSSLPAYRDRLLKGQSLSLVLPEIVGIGGRKTYLILFQNNLELRPTGGFITAFGVISLENGKLINFEIYDIYEADNRLKGQVEPPAKIKEILGEQVWYFRDANFDPEFSASAAKALWFLDKEMNITADGVIAVNLKFLEGALGVLGEVEVPGLPDKISAGNLFQKVMHYSEQSSLDQGQKKEEFLVSLIKALYERSKKTTPQKVLGLEGVAFSQLENKEMLFYATDQKIERQITDLGWDGNLRQYQNKIEGYSVFNDFLSINEANLGINKVNYFMSRKVEHEIKIDNQGAVQEKLSFVYENKSPSENWPAGIYKNYLRVYLPRGAKPFTLLRTDPAGSDVWIPFPDNGMEIYEDNGKTVLGLFFEVPVKSKTKLEINYELEEKINLSAKINSYLLMVQKQPGIYTDDYSLIVLFPEKLVPLRVIPKAIIGGGKLLINEKLDRDRIFQIDLAI